MRIRTNLTAVLALAGGLWAVAAPAEAAIITLQANLSGLNEIPPADPDGTGTALVHIDDAANTIDWTITVTNIGLDITAAHIHIGAAGVVGPPVVDFSGMLNGTDLADPDLTAVLANPSGFYVNVHNSAFPAGAVRGQLFAVPEPVGIGLIALALGIAGLRRRTARDC